MWHCFFTIDINCETFLFRFFDFPNCDAHSLLSRIES